MTTARRRSAYVIASLVAMLLDCQRAGSSGGQGSPDHAAATPDARSDAGKDSAQSSDLDRPLDELFRATCEHKKPTFECDECRYQVGVVRAPASLFDGGLLKVTSAKMRPLALPLDLTGEVQFDQRRVAHVSSQAQGIIRRVYVTLGDEIKRGRPLLEIESIGVGEAQADSLSAQGMLTLARRDYERVAALRSENIASEKELLRAKQDLDAAQIRADAARSKLVRLGTGPSQAAPTGRLALRAPADGTVLEMHAVPGEIAKPEQSLVTVGDNASLWVWADLYERDIAVVVREQAKQPLAAVVSVKAFPGEEFPGTLDFVSPAMSESSRTVKLRIAVPNGTGRLLSGMFANVRLFLPVSERALTVPRTAVLEDEGRSFVFVRHHDDYYVRRPVTTGRALAGWVEIRKGLAGDETIVSDGAFLMKADVLRSKMGAGCAD